MNFSRLIPLTAALLLGCSSESRQPQKPSPVRAMSLPANALSVETERQREPQMPCSAVWQRPEPEFRQPGSECSEHGLVLCEDGGAANTSDSINGR
jgi:hypothetical protein